MPSSRIKIALMLWCLAEIGVAACFVHVVGWTWTLLAGLLTSVIGFNLLRRRGTAALIKLRASFRGRLAGSRGGGGRGEVIDGALAVLGALALLLPGFLSDLVGFALLVRPVRDRIAAAIGSRRWAFIRTGGLAGRRHVDGVANGPGAIDLEPGEWRNGDIRPARDLRR